jgi:hypothetical protein
MHSATAGKPAPDRDLREICQCVATLEVLLVGFVVEGFTGRATVTNQLVRRLRHLADEAVFERDGLVPEMLDRVADRLAAGIAGRVQVP